MFRNRFKVETGLITIYTPAFCVHSFELMAQLMGRSWLIIPKNEALPLFVHVSFAFSGAGMSDAASI